MNKNTDYCGGTDSVVVLMGSAELVLHIHECRGVALLYNYCLQGMAAT